MSHWRNKSRRVIAEALKTGAALGLEGKALDKHISAAYPFGERSMHPYAIWLSQIKIQVPGKQKQVEKVEWPDGGEPFALRANEGE